MDIPMNVEVSCTDGLYGRSYRVVLNPKTKQITHVIVKEANISKVERLIPIRFIGETTPDMIHLNCTVQQASKMNKFFCY